MYRVLERLELWLYRSSRIVILLTPAFARDLESRGIERSKLRVVINGANLELFRPRPRDEVLATELGLQGRFVIGYLGTIGLAHDLANVVRAARLLVSTNITFLFVGVGAAKEELERQVKSEGLANVIFVRRQAKEAMPSYWSICDVALVHLKGDPVFGTVIPSKIFEGMAMGVPILYVGPEGEGPAIIRETGSGVVVPPGKPEELAAAARRLATDGEARAALAAASRAAAPRYSRARQSEATLAILREATSLS